MPVRLQAIAKRLQAHLNVAVFCNILRYGASRLAQRLLRMSGTELGGSPAQRVDLKNIRLPKPERSKA